MSIVQYENRLQELNQVFLELSQCEAIDNGELETALKVITKATTKSLGCERSSVWTYNEERTSIILRMLYIASTDEYHTGFELFAKDYPAYFAYLEEAQSLAAHDAHTDPSTFEFSQGYLTPLGIGAMLDAPVRISGQMAGVICNEHVGPARQWSPEEQTLAGHLADLVTRAYSGKARQDALQELAELNADLERRVEEKTRDIRSMLDNLNQGIFTVRNDLRVESEHSKHLVQMVGNQDLAGQNCLNMMFANSNLNSEDVSRISNALQICIGENELNWSLNSEELPNHVTKTLNGQSQYIEIEWLPLFDSDENVEKVMIIMRDVTRLRELEQAAKDKSLNSAIFEALIQQGFDSIDIFLSSPVCQLHHPTERLKQGNNIPSLLRDLHTLKGNSRSMGFGSISQHIHECEEAVRAYLSGESGALEHFTESWTAAQKQLAHVTTIQNQIKEAAHAKKHTLKEHLNILAEPISHLAVERGLEPLHFVWSGDLDWTPTTSEASLLRDTLNHLMRNSLAHGIESADVRLQKGKVPNGTVFLNCKKQNGKCQIEFWDDGQGLNMDKLRATAKNRNIDATDDQKVIQQIFESGISTASQLDNVAGRGVGLDAVREIAQSHNGELSCTTQPIPNSTFRSVQFLLNWAQSN
jgi:signal transduction histidine kinase